MLIQRVLSALVLIPIVGVCLFFGGFWFLALVTAVAMLAAHEFFGLMKLKGYAPVYLLGMGSTLLLVIGGMYPDLPLASLTLGVTTMLVMVLKLVKGNLPGSLESWALTIAGPVYIGGLARHFVMLRELPSGMYWIGLAILITWVCDSAAYFIGTWIGSRPFFKPISPKKTMEGAVAGLVAGTLAGAGFGALMLGLPAYLGLALGLVVSLAATFGDLAESLIKRQVGVKDSSNLIPGHGGMLDRIDSLLFAVTVMYYCGLWLPLV
jgi:phosphatidate cytidylyltransferase